MPVPIERSKDAFLPVLWRDEDALNPQEHAVAPVAPLERRGQLAEYGAVSFRYEIASLARVFEKRANAARNGRRIEMKVLAFESEIDVELGECRTNNFLFRDTSERC